MKQILRGAVFAAAAMVFMQTQCEMAKADTVSGNGYEMQISSDECGMEEMLVPETENSFNNAVSINMGDTEDDTITETERVRIYRFSLSSSGRISLGMKSYMQWYTVEIVNDKGNQIWYSQANEWNGNLSYREDKYNINLLPGNYYLRVTGYKYTDGRAGYAVTGNYSIKTSFSPVNESFNEPNNEFSKATNLGLNQQIVGHIAINDREDIFQLTSNQDLGMSVEFQSYMKWYSFQIFDSAGKEIWYSDHNEWNSNLEYRKDVHEVMLSAGKYYIRVSGYYRRNETYDGSTGMYKFILSSQVNISATAISKPADQVYNGNEKKPKITVSYQGKNLTEGTDYEVSYENNQYIGKAAIKVTGKGKYCGSKTVSFRIIPPKVSGINAGKGKKKQAYVSWSQIYGVDGYEVYRSTKKKAGFKGVKKLQGQGSTYYLNKKLKRRKVYYYKVRAYKVIDGAKCYGAFSTVKKVKTR